MVGAPARSPTQLCEIRARSGRDPGEIRPCARSAHAHAPPPPHACASANQRGASTCAKADRAYDQRAIHIYIHTYIYIYIYIYTPVRRPIVRTISVPYTHTYTYIYTYTPVRRPTVRTISAPLGATWVNDSPAAAAASSAVQSRQRAACRCMHACVCMHVCVCTHACMHVCVMCLCVCNRGRGLPAGGRWAQGGTGGF